MASCAFSFCILLISWGCGRPPEESLAQAYVAPASVNLRSQLNQKNSSFAVLNHGDPVSIVDVRRRYVKVRTLKGAEGWLDSLDLLSADDMQRIKRERVQDAFLPSEGAATAYETLNIHLDPSRKSPAFAQIAEGGSVSILAHRLAPKVTVAPRPNFVFDRPKPVSRRKQKAQAKNIPKGPPMPPAPKPPANWQELSGASADRGDSNADPSEGENAAVKNSSEKSGEKKSPILEDWTLVRTKSNRIGWVLSRNLMMSIPDEVAQYAEGKHITSFFDLGNINDEEKGLKHNWLWTTRSGPKPFDFDSWRVFLWNRHRHRYETSYRQRDVQGYFPVHVDPADPAFIGRTFELITEDDDGKIRRRVYRFDGSRVHLTGTEDYHVGVDTQTTTTKGVDTKNLQDRMARGSSWLKRKWLSLEERFSSR